MDAEIKRIMAEEELIDAALRFAVERRDADARDAINFAEWYAVEYPDGDKELSVSFDYWMQAYRA